MKGKANLLTSLLCLLYLLSTRPIAFAQTAGAEPAPPGPAEIIYVDDDAAGANVGSSWANAINSLQDAILLAYFLEKPVEIRVAEGTYTPDRGIGIMPGDREASFELINGVTIKGGYAGLGYRDQNLRDIILYKTILSGDLDNDDGPDFTNNSENSYHVMTGYETDRTAVLDGLTITGGNARGLIPNNRGGGLYNERSDATLMNCTSTGNSGAAGAGICNVDSNPILVDCLITMNRTLGGAGGGMHNSNSNPVMLNCIVSANSAGHDGGGMLNYQSKPALTNCTFSENTAGNGGGMYNSESSPMLSDCIFHGNSTTESGGGLYNNNSSNPIFLSCMFSENSAQENGGGMYVRNDSNPTMNNCTFYGNSATYGGAIQTTGSFSIITNNNILYNSATKYGGGICSENAYPAVTNTIIWDNSPDEIYERRLGRGGTSGQILVTYSNIKGGWPGKGNIDADPLFADADNGDYHLKSQVGRWDPIRQSWVIDQTSSLCIDAGDPNIPIGLERFPNGGRSNIGVYGGTPEASLSPWQALGLLTKASNPEPADGAEVSPDVILSWSPGKNALWHDVYFGTDFNDVNNANPYWTYAAGVYKGRQEPNEYQPETLDYDQIYYWRIDEVDSEGLTKTGDLWSFSTRRPHKGRTCFTGRTLIWADGELVPISEVASNQSINIIDTIGKVEEVQEHTGTFVCYDVLLESGNCITVAENHYFMTVSGQWVALQDLKAGTNLQTAKGSIRIISITKRPCPYSGKVYNLKINGSDRYMVGEDAVIVRDY